MLVGRKGQRAANAGKKASSPTKPLVPKNDKENTENDDDTDNNDDNDDNTVNDDEHKNENDVKTRVVSNMEDKTTTMQTIMYEELMKRLTKLEQLQSQIPVRAPSRQWMSSDLLDLAWEDNAVIV